MIAVADGSRGEEPDRHGANGAVAGLGEIRRRLAGRRAAVFLDYDGTLAPIAPRPDLAVLAAPVRETLRRLAALCPTAVVSGRALPDLARQVGLEGLYYCGNHGLEIRRPGPGALRLDHGREYLGAIDAAHREIAAALAPLPGIYIEHKTYSLSIHYRQVPAARVPGVEAAVDAVLRGRPELRRHGGKQVIEVRPALDWDKGKAVLWLLDALGLDGPDDVVPVYIGDDATDEDAFRALQGRGIGILVNETPRVSFAEYALADPEAVHGFLNELIELLAGARPRR